MPDRFSEVVLILVGSTFIILVLVALVIATMLINQKRKFRHKLEMSGLRSEYDRALLQSQLEIQSQTFETISRELHDNVGTLLSIAMVHLRSQLAQQDQEHAKMSEVESLLNEAMDMLRDISRSLDPGRITTAGWEKSFLKELDRIKRLNLFSVHTSVTGNSFPIEASRQIILFRILQEAMNNIVKHAEATDVKVNLAYAGDQLEVVINDNGRGIHSMNARATDGAGLRNMMARALMLPATFEITSEDGSGTTITIRYKLQNKYGKQ
jgi:two-component system, NarL family, sensor kinase